MNRFGIGSRWQAFSHVWRRHADRIRTPQHRVLVVAGTFVGSAFLAALLFWLPIGLSVVPMTWQEAWFLAVSALTASGSALHPIVTRLTPAGMWVLLALLQCGGAGFMSATVTVLQRLGVPIFKQTTIRGSRLFLAALTIEAWAGVLLAWQWRALFPSYGDALFAGLFHATSAFSNAGFDWVAPGSPLFVMINDLPSLAVIATTVLIGSLGLPVVVDVVTSRRRLAQTTVSVAVTCTLVLGGMVALWATPEWQLLHAHESFATQLMAALFDALTWRTAGIFTDTDLMQLPVATRIALLFAMFAGCAPGTMGGGVTPTTVVVVAVALWGMLRRHQQATLFGQPISPAFVRRASIMLISSVLLVCGMALVVSVVDGVPADYAVVLATASFATSNVNTAGLAQLSWISTTLLSVGMLWGRIGVFLVVASLYGHAQPKQPPTQIWAG